MPFFQKYTGLVRESRYLDCGPGVVRFLQSTTPVLGSASGHHRPLGFPFHKPNEEG